MAKKYLLYIHDNEAFDKEMYKSELVNRLLKEHWAKLTPGEYVAPIEDIEELKGFPPEPLIFDSDREVIKICKHGFPNITCKFAKPGKVCK